MAKDTQRGKAYEAEFVLRDALNNANQTRTRSFDFFGSMLTLPEERKFGTVENVQAYVDQVLRMNWVRSTWDLARLSVKVRERKGQASAHYSASRLEIAVPMERTWALREVVVLHEIAHHLTPGDPGHGAEFCGALVLLVSEIIGPEAGLVLRWAMESNGAKVDNKVLTIA